MMTFRNKAWVLFAAWLLSPLLLRAQQKQFALHDGDRVVFYGDSITAQRLYTTYLQVAVHARYPNWKIGFYNAGVGGDTVFGGIAGKIDARIDRDVLQFQPTVVTIMLGMNDGGHVSEYEAGYAHILDRLREKSPGIRITILGPTPKDGATDHNAVANVELRQFLEIDRRLAAKYGATFIDLQTPVLAALEHAERVNHLAAMSLIPDRVHPQSPIHMLMAETILDGWNYPDESSRLVLDAKGHVATQTGVSVSNVAQSEGGLRWTALETADEMRFLTTDGNEALYQALVERQHIGAKVLRIPGLARGRYELLIDGKPLTQTWTEKELDAGIQLDRLDTPAHRAGVAIYYACSDSELNQTERSRLLGTVGGSIQNGDAMLQAAMLRSEKRIADAARPVEHHFELRRATETK